MYEINIKQSYALLRNICADSYKTKDNIETIDERVIHKFMQPLNLNFVCDSS
jgi:hypothetical protein